MTDCRDRIAWTQFYRSGTLRWEDALQAEEQAPGAAHPATDRAAEAFRGALVIVDRVMLRAWANPDAVEDLPAWVRRAFRTVPPAACHDGGGRAASVTCA
jgi:hypothetical protein